MAIESLYFDNILTTRQVDFFIKIYVGSYNVYITDGNYTVGTANDKIIRSALTKLPDTIEQEIDIFECTSTISSVNFSVVNTPKDENNDSNTIYTISELLYMYLFSTESIIEKKVEVIKWIDRTDFEILYTGILKNPSNDIYETEYTFQVQDLKRILKNNCLQLTTNDNETFDVTTAMTDLPYKKTGRGTWKKIIRRSLQGNIGEITKISNYFETDDQNVLNAYNSTATGNLIINENYQITNLGTTTDWSSCGGDNPAKLGDTFKATSNGSSITGGTVKLADDYWYVLIFEGTPAELLDALVMNFTKTEGGIDDIIDSISKGIVENDSKNTVINYLHWEFKEPLENAWDFIQSEIFRLLSCYNTLGSDGKIYLKIQKQPSISDPIITLDDGNIDELIDNNLDFSKIVNNVIMKLDYNIEDNEYLTGQYEIDNSNITELNPLTSFDIFGLKPENPESIELKGLNKLGSFNTGDYKTFSTNIANYLFNRLSSAVKYLTFNIFEHVGKDIEIGDFVFLEYSKLINWRSTKIAKRGTTANYDTYCKIDENAWGDYTTSYEDNTMLSDNAKSSFSIVCSPIENGTNLTKDKIYDVVAEDLTDIQLYSDINTLIFVPKSFLTILIIVQERELYIESPTLYPETLPSLDYEIDTEYGTKIQTSFTVTKNFFTGILENYKINNNFIKIQNRFV